MAALVKVKVYLGENVKFADEKGFFKFTTNETLSYLEPGSVDVLRLKQRLIYIAQRDYNIDISKKKVKITLLV